MRIKKSLTSFFKRLLFAVEVKGMSAWPELVPGRRYLATSLGTPGVGDFVVFRHPFNHSEILVKQVERRIGDSYSVRGLIPGATSSRDIGLVPKSLVLGTILRRND